MHHLDPAISTLRDTSTRLAVALGAVQYLETAVGSDDDATVDNALNVVATVNRELDATLTTLLSLGTQLNRLTEDTVDIQLDTKELCVYPSPGQEGLDIDFGDVRVIAPAGPALDELMKVLSDMYRLVGKGELSTGATSSI